MKLYHFRRTYILPVTLEEAWAFFSTPENLAKITPPAMDFRIVYRSGGARTYAGQLIQYTIRVAGLRIRWITEITQVSEPNHFIDEQRFGPYAFWHHQHMFREVDGGVEMTDELSYGLPLGFIGRIAHALFVRSQINTIFDFRQEALGRIFGT